MTRTRRDVLQVLGTAGAAGALAGCLGGGGGDEATTATTTEATTATTTTTTTTTEETTETTEEPAMTGPTLEVTTHPDLGAMLTDGEGMSLYLFTQDSEGETVCYDDCAEAWPPLTVEGSPTVPEGLPGEVGTIERDGGSTQVTYNGMPLYYFVQDESPGEVKGQGVQGVWFVVPPTGGDGVTAHTVKVSSHPDHGAILTDGRGMTLYRFTQDSEGETVCYDDCAEAWPPLTVESLPVATPSVAPHLGTIERDGGSTQVTYDGMPLYYFVQDEQPGDATGQGVQDVWFVVEGPSTMSAPSSTLSVSTHPDQGVILTDGDGMTLYRFTQDEDGTSVCYDDCAEAWPPLTAEGAVPVARGVPGPVGTTERDGGAIQVTYDRRPLYYFVRDESAGDATGQGVQDVWFVVRPKPGGSTMGSMGGSDDGGSSDGGSSGGGSDGGGSDGGGSGGGSGGGDNEPGGY